MILLLILGFVCVAAEDLVEDAKENCNCTRLLNQEEAITDPPPTFPTTSFTCWGRYDGYYADIEVDCTIFHYCQTWQFPTGLNETVKWDFACPQSTIFNQKILSCTPPNISFNCQESPNYYWVNWINLTESTTFTPTEVPDYSTPDYNLGQQLIVGGLKPHEAPISTNTHDDNELASAHREPTISYPQEVPNPEPGSGEFPEAEQPQVTSNSVNQELVPEDSNVGQYTEALEQGVTSDTINQDFAPEASEQGVTSVTVNQDFVPEDSNAGQSTEAVEGVTSGVVSEEQVGSDSGQQSSTEGVPEGLNNENNPEAIHFPV